MAERVAAAERAAAGELAAARRSATAEITAVHQALAGPGAAASLVPGPQAGPTVAGPDPAVGSPGPRPASAPDPVARPATKSAAGGDKGPDAAPGTYSEGVSGSGWHTPPEVLSDSEVQSDDGSESGYETAPGSPAYHPLPAWVSAPAQPGPAFVPVQTRAVPQVLPAPGAVPEGGKSAHGAGTQTPVRTDAEEALHAAVPAQPRGGSDEPATVVRRAGRSLRELLDETAAEEIQRQPGHGPEQPVPVRRHLLPPPIEVAGRHVSAAWTPDPVQAEQGGTGSWWSGLMGRPVTVATGLPGNDRVIEYPLRAAPPDLSTPAVGAVADADPVTAAAERMAARVDTLVDQFARPAPPLDSFPGRSRLARFLTKALPFLGARRAHDVLTLPAPGPVRLMPHAAPGTSRFLVQEAVHAEVSRRWPAAGTGQAAARTDHVPPRGPAAGQAERAGAAELAEAAHVGRLRRMSGEYQAARARLDSAPAGSEMALRAAEDLADVARRRTGEADLAAYGRLAAEESAGHALLQGLELARGRARSWADSLAALTAASATVSVPVANPAVDRATARAVEAAETLDAAHASGRRAQERVRAALSALDEQMLQVAVQHPEGFPADARSDGLRAGLARLLAELPRARRDDGIPHQALLRVLTSGLRAVTDDPVRAARLLDAVLAHRALELIPEPVGSDKAAAPTRGPATGTSEDLRALWGELALIDRGIELLGQVSERAVAPLDNRTIAALTVYWRADAAERTLLATQPGTPSDPAGTDSAGKGSAGTDSADKGSAAGSTAGMGSAATEPAGKESVGTEPGADDPLAQDREWLAAARQAAARRLHGGAAGGGSGHERAAYTGVLNGLLSVGPGSRYAEANHWLDTLFETWVQRAATEPGLLERVWSRLRLADKTPLTAGTLASAQRLGQAFGFSTHQEFAARALDRGAAALVSLARERSAAGEGTSGSAGVVPADLVLAETWGRWVQRQPFPGLASRVVTTKDAGSLVGVLSEVTGGTGPAEGSSRRGDLRGALLKDLAAAAGRGETLTGAVVRWANRLAPAHGVGAGPQLVSLKRDLEEAMHHLAAADRPVGTAGDVAAFLDPMLREWGIRQNLRVTQGHTLGVANLALPLFLHNISQKVSFFVVPQIDGGVRKDAYLDVQFPSSIGLQLTIGRQSAGTAGVSVTAGPYLTLSRRARFSAAVTATGRGTWVNGEGVVLRLPRQRGHDGAHRTHMRRLLADLAGWQDARDEHATPYRDRLEFLLAEHPDVTVAPLEARRRTLGADLTLRAGVPVAIVPKALVGGPLVTMQASVERTVEARREAQGQLRMPDDQASVATQRVRASVGAAVSSGALPLWSDGSAPLAASNMLVMGLPPAAGTVTREFWQRMERKRLDVMVSGQKMDAEYDRELMNSGAVLAEIRANRLEWVRRGMDSRSDVPAELRDSLGHDLVDADLTRFEESVGRLTQASEYAGYIVRYGPRPVARVMADVYGVLTELATRRGEPERARHWVQARNEVLRTDHNWRPRTLLARERGMAGRNRGLAMGLRTQTHDQVDVSRTVVQFPPDSGVGRPGGVRPDRAGRAWHGRPAAVPTPSGAVAVPSVGAGTPVRRRPDDHRLGWSWGVIKGTALPPDEREWRRRRARMLAAAPTTTATAMTAPAAATVIATATATAVPPGPA
ncbi:MAG TPA: hypothetical protein VFP72_23700 [Kineosporiaceae bacterium]|nr:hypothetical protein [Kineosporiaceae bacterium]